jgi:hypothetical protein
VLCTHLSMSVLVMVRDDDSNHDALLLSARMEVCTILPHQHQDMARLGSIVRAEYAPMIT